MQKLSKREKIMIYAMILTIIIGCIFLIIKPLIKEYQKAQDNYFAKEMEAENAKISVGNIDTVTEQKSQLINQVIEKQSYFPKPVTNDYLEQIVLSYAETAGFNINSSEITGATPTSMVINGVTTNQNELGTKQQTEGEQASDLLGADEENNILGADVNEEYNINTGLEVEQANTEDVMVGTVYISCEGTMSQLYRLLNTCKSDPVVAVASVSIYDMNETPFSNDDEIIRTFYLTINYYMLLEPSDTVKALIDQGE